MPLSDGRKRILEGFGALSIPSEELRIERILAAARTFLALTSLVAIWLDPTEPIRYAPFAYGLMGFYVAYSLLIQFMVLFRNPPTTAFRFGVHVVDILWPMLMSLATSGPNSPFYLFNVFVLSAAAYRWGLRETLATAGAAILLYSSEAFLVPATQGGAPFYLGGGLELNRILLRTLNLLTLGFLLGYLGEEEKSLRAEASATARLTTRIQSSAGLRAAFHNVLKELCDIFGSPHAVAFLHENASGRLFRWEAFAASNSGASAPSPVEVMPEERALYSINPPARAWHATQSTDTEGVKVFDLVTVDESGRPLRGATWCPPPTLLEAYPFRQVLGVSQAFGNEWSGMMMLLDPHLKSSRGSAVSYLLALARYTGPAIYNVYLASRLRTRAGAVERARVARELHDGVIQSLISLEMQIDVLRRHQGTASDHVAGELQRIQNLLRQEVLNLRELMQQMTPVHIVPKHLLEFLASTVDKFRRDTGIAATFTSTLEEVNLPPRVCTEVARIMQEALVNIRKHSGAKNVLVRLEAEGGNWKLVIDDDGHGFDFSGHLSQDDLDISRRGPMVIKERVRSINGELAIDSIPGGGARLEITFPQKTDG